VLDLKVHSHLPLVYLDTRPSHFGRLFKNGDVFWGQVLELHRDQTATITAKGIRFQARSQLPLRAGQQYRFFVQQLGEQTILRVLTPQANQTNRLLQCWQVVHRASRVLMGDLARLAAASQQQISNERSAKELQRLSRLLPVITLEPTTVLAGSWLANQLLSGGLFWEHKIWRWLVGRGAQPLFAEDLKGILLKLPQALTEFAESKERQRLAQLGREVLQLVEAQQQYNVLSRRDPGHWFWFVPARMEKDHGGVEIFVTEDKEHKKEQGDFTFKVCMRLCLSCLGSLQADIQLRSKRLSCRLLVESEEVAAWISARLVHLEKALAARGFQVGVIGCSAADLQKLPPPLSSEGMAKAEFFHTVL